MIQIDTIFGKKLLCEISRVDIETYIDSLSSVYSNVTANRSLSVLKKVFGHGLKLKAVIGDPSEEYGILIKAVEALNRMDFLRAIGGGMINTKRARKMAAQSMTVTLQLVHYAYALGKQAGMRE